MANLRIWQLDAPWTLTADQLTDAIASAAFTECGPGQAETIGWEPVHGPEGEVLAQAIGGHIVLRARRQERILPNAALQELLPERLAEEADREGRPPGARRRREITDALRAELLPRALRRSARNWLIIDPDNGRLIVDTSSAARGEAILSLLRGSLGSLRLRPLAFAQVPSEAMTAWLQRDAPEGLEIGTWCDLEHPLDPSHKVRVRGQTVAEDDEVRALAADLRVTALELIHGFDAAATRFVLAEDASLRRVRWPTDSEEPDSDESPEARLDADLLMTALGLREILATLATTLGGIARADS